MALEMKWEYGMIHPPIDRDQSICNDPNRMGGADCLAMLLVFGTAGM